MYIHEGLICVDEAGVITLTENLIIKVYMNQMYTLIKLNLPEHLKITYDLYRSGVFEEYDEKTALLGDILELKEEKRKSRKLKKGEVGG